MAARPSTPPPQSAMADQDNPPGNISTKRPASPSPLTPRAPRIAPIFDMSSTPAPSSLARADAIRGRPTAILSSALKSKTKTPKKNVLFFEGVQTNAPAGQLSEFVQFALRDEELDKLAKREILVAAAEALDSALSGHTAGPRKKWADIAKNTIQASLSQLVTGTNTIPPSPPMSPPRPADNQRQDANNGHCGPTDASKTPSGDRKRGSAPGPTHTTPPQQARAKANTARPAAAPTPAPQKPGNNKDTPPAPQENSPWTTVGPKSKNKRPTHKAEQDQDSRLFVRIAQDHPMRNMSGTDVRVNLTMIAQINLTDITEAKPIQSGWAIRPRTKEARTRLLTPYPLLEKSNITIEEAEHWHTYIVTDVPKQVMAHNGAKDASLILPAETQAQTGTEPISCRPTRHQDDQSNTQNWVISFKTNVKPGFRILGSKPARRLEKKTKITQCTNCQGFHDPRDCQRLPKCRHCGQTHDPSNCDNPPKCTNCLGPHTSDALACPARPTRRDGKIHKHTKKQLAAIRSLGEMAYKEAHRPKTTSAPPPAPPRPEEAPAQPQKLTTTAAPEPAAAPRPTFVHHSLNDDDDMDTDENPPQ